MSRSRTVFEARSPLSGRVRVIEDHRERRLVVGGDILSVYPLDGDWSRLEREYWWRAVAAVALPPRPAALLVGLGGGTQVHLLRAMSRPRGIAVIEHDPVILRVARDWFGLAAVGGIEFLCGDAERVIPWLESARRRFDFVMEDAAYAEAPERSLPLARSLVPLVSPRGVLVINRHRRGDAAGLAAALRPFFRDVRLRRVRREADNVLICCAGPRQVRGRRL
jgi:spermidine synthase